MRTAAAKARRADVPLPVKRRPATLVFRGEGKTGEVKRVKMCWSSDPPGVFVGTGIDVLDTRNGLGTRICGIFVGTEPQLDGVERQTRVFCMADVTKYRGEATFADLVPPAEMSIEVRFLLKCKFTAYVHGYIEETPAVSRARRRSQWTVADLDRALATAVSRIEDARTHLEHGGELDDAQRDLQVANRIVMRVERIAKRMEAGQPGRR